MRNFALGILFAVFAHCTALPQNDSVAKKLDDYLTGVNALNKFNGDALIAAKKNPFTKKLQV